MYFLQDNYVHFDYIAETYNTLSNVAFLVLGMHGFLTSRGLPHSTRHALAHLGMVLVGAGSFIFHGTLLWHAQVLLDELPMIWTACLLVYITRVAKDGKGSRTIKIWCSLVAAIISGI